MTGLAPSQGLPQLRIGYKAGGFSRTGSSARGHSPGRKASRRCTASWIFLGAIRADHIRVILGRGRIVLPC